MGLSDGVPNAPANATGEILEARTRAVQAILDAEDAEKGARTQRRQATSLLKAYEHLLEEHRGQLRLEIDDARAHGR